MTENEAIEVIKKRKKCDIKILEGCARDCPDCDFAIWHEDILLAAYDTAIMALEEIQKYKDIGAINQIEKQR